MQMRRKGPPERPENAWAETSRQWDGEGGEALQRGGDALHGIKDGRALFGEIKPVGGEQPGGQLGPVVIEDGLPGGHPAADLPPDLLQNRPPPPALGGQQLPERDGVPVGDAPGVPHADAAGPPRARVLPGIQPEAEQAVLEPGDGKVQRGFPGRSLRSRGGLGPGQ